MHSDLALAFELQAPVSAASNSSFSLGIKGPKDNFMCVKHTRVGEPRCGCARLGAPTYVVIDEVRCKERRSNVRIPRIIPTFL